MAADSSVRTQGECTMVYSLSAMELIIFVATDLVIVGVGYVAFRQWTQREAVPPVWFVGVMLVGAFVVYGLVARQLWLSADTSGTFVESAAVPEVDGAGPETTMAQSPGTHPYVARAEFLANRGSAAPFKAGAQPNRLPVLVLYCLAFWTIPVAYYTYVLLGSIGAWWVERRSWMEMPIDEEEAPVDDGDFDRAKELALSGDTIGALGAGKTFSKRRVNGCFAAARILEAEGRFEDAAGVLREIADQSAGVERVWAEGMFRLGVLQEKCLEKPVDAMLVFDQVSMRCPDDPHGRMARVALHKLRAGGDALLSVLDAGFERPGTSPLEATPELAGTTTWELDRG